MDFSDYEDGDASSDFVPEPVAKPKAKAASKKSATLTAKTKAPAKKAAGTASKPKARPAASKKKDKDNAENEISDDDPVLPGDDSLSVTPPNPPRSKATPREKDGPADPLAALENEVKKSSSDKYRRLSPVEHILTRPDTYIGSIERTEQQMWVYNSETELMEYREVSFVPGLYKIFDEIIVNAADNKQNDQSMDEIRVTIDREAGEISVWNNGRGIPVEIHSKEKVYIPEMIFGHLLTSSNYDDNQQKVTGGRNGYGAKLCNIFSNEFTVETADSNTKKKFKLTWTDNMSKMGKPKITDYKGDDYTKVTFKPDFKRFGMENGMDDDFVALVKRRVYDLAGTVKVTVKLNGTRVNVRNFKRYMELYMNAIKKERGEDAQTDKSELITDNPDPRWEVGFAVSDGTFQQVSFVNSIATTSGGTHVNYIADQICNRLVEVLKKKNKTGATLKPAQIRNHIFIFVNCLIVNPAFTSQTKEQLTTKVSQFGSKCTLSEDFFKKIINKTQVMDNILHFAERKADQIMKKTDGGRRQRMNNPKLVDANKAGTKEGYRCTLILTEGDSAKGLAMAGRAVVGPDHFGVFPLRGKLLNVRDATVDQISKNQEIQNIKSFLGLQHKKEYTDTKGLRYGHLMIMTDQDHDGSHIKGLLINYFQCAFPSLLKIPGFLLEFITPIVKVWKGDPKNPSKVKRFFTMPEYEAWKAANNDGRGWQKKYYKGLGTSSAEDTQVYFTDLDRHLKEFHAMQENEEKLIELAFSKKKADERKEWLRQFKPGTYLDHSVDKITYTDFINKELILFSMADNIRSIPSVVDGFKPGQRKVLYTCFQRNQKKDVKVVELAGFVSGLTAYQHGETSLQQTIVGLAQNFVGSNNVNCLEPSGNFGSRLQGGSDAASARYIYTRLSPFARRIFHPIDDALLKHNIDDGKPIEPEIYVPVIPMILVNGADGIGTGWSTSIPNYNPEEIVENLKRMMDGKEPIPMKPWFRGFTGEVTGSGDKWKFSGIIKQTGDNEVEITELPIRTWTQDFKDRLEEIIKAEKVPSFIKDYKDYNTNTKVHFVIQLDDKHAKRVIEEGLEEKFKLSKTITTSNMVAFDAEGRITKYDTAEDILKAFYAVRIKYYEKRKQYQLDQMQKELDKLTNQARFIQMIIDGKLVISKKSKSTLMQELKEKGFKPIPKVADPAKQGETEELAEDEEAEPDNAEIGSDAYDYLLSMPLWSLTKERVEKLRQQIGDKEMEVDTLIKLSKEDIWKKDLDDFLEAWRTELEEERRREKKLSSMGRRASTKLKTGGRAPASKKRKAVDGDDDDDSDFAAPKPKKSTATVSRVKPKGGLMDYLVKASPKPKTKAKGFDGASGTEESEPEVLPQKKREPRAAAKKAPVVDTFEFSDDDDDFPATAPTPSSAEEPKPTGATTTRPEVPSEVLSELEDAPAERVEAAAPIQELSELDDAPEEEEIMPKKTSESRAATKAAPSKKADSPVEILSDEASDGEVKAKKPATKSRAGAAKPTTKTAKSKAPAKVTDESDFSDVVSKPAPRRAARKPIKYSDALESDDSDNSDQLGDVSQMVKGVGNIDDSRTLFSETSRLGAGAGARSTKKVRKGAIQDDETDYSKLIPSKSPRQSLTVKPKDVKAIDIDDEEDDEPTPPAKSASSTKASTTTKGTGTTKPAPKTTKSAATSSKGNKTAATKPAMKQTQLTLSPAAKAYASKKAKAGTGKNLADDLSDGDDIDAMVDDILDSPPAAKQSAPVAVSGRPSRRAASTKKPTYTVDLDSDDDDDDYGGGDDESGDEFYDLE
ncbi:hypothetical protein VTO42DRAFT_4408 [Malbranchea cinnamomea]